MRNRAKCKKCQEIIESFHRHDYVTCKCGEISVDGGDTYYKCSAIDFNNFLRIDDEGNEIAIIMKEKEEVKQEEFLETHAIEQDFIKTPELIDIVDAMIESMKGMPEQALGTYVTQYDFLSLLSLFDSTLKNIDMLVKTVDGKSG